MSTLLNFPSLLPSFSVDLISPPQHTDGPGNGISQRSGDLIMISHLVMHENTERSAILNFTEGQDFRLRIITLTISDLRQEIKVSLVP